MRVKLPPNNALVRIDVQLCTLSDNLIELTDIIGHLTSEQVFSIVFILLQNTSWYEHIVVDLDRHAKLIESLLVTLCVLLEILL